MNKQSNNKVVSCFGKNSNHGKIAKGESVKLYSSSIESSEKSVMKRELLKDQCVPHMCRDVNNIVENKLKHKVKVDQFVDVNPYEILADIDFSVVVRQSDGESCHEASVLMTNGRNLIKGKKNQFQK